MPRSRNAGPGFDFTIVTHRALPDGAPDDILLAEELRARSKSVRFAVWDDDGIDWSLSPTTIVRSTWDYFKKPSLWLEWIKRTQTATRLINDPEILSWNTDKRYLLDLIAKGVRCVPTEIVNGPRQTLAEICKRRRWKTVIVKPAIAAGATGTKLFSANETMAGQAHMEKLLLSGTVIVQPYLREVETLRERSLTFISGRFHHAFSKPAFSANMVGETAIEKHEPNESEKALGYAALAALTHDVTYARVDLVPAEKGPMIMEVELIEPDLGLRPFPDAAGVLADSLVRFQVERSIASVTPDTVR